MNEHEIQAVEEMTVKKKRPKRSEELQPHVEEGYNSKTLLQVIHFDSLPSIDTNDAEQINKRVDEWIRICAENDIRPTVENLGLALKVGRQRIWEWETQETKGKDVADAIKRAKRILSAFTVDMGVNGKINPVSLIFILKNNYGYTDKQEVVITPNNPLGESQNTAEVEQRYIESVAEDAES